MNIVVNVIICTLTISDNLSSTTVYLGSWVTLCEFLLMFDILRCGTESTYDTSIYHNIYLLYPFLPHTLFILWFPPIGDTSFLILYLIWCCYIPCCHVYGHSVELSEVILYPTIRFYYTLMNLQLIRFELY